MATPRNHSATQPLLAIAQDQATIAYFKALYLKDMRSRPEAYFEGETLATLDRLEDRRMEQKELRNTSCSIITYNPPCDPSVVDPETAHGYFRIILRRLAAWTWVRGLYYVIELAPDTGRPHLHLVLHQCKKRSPSDIHRQIWRMAHEASMLQLFPWLEAPGHNKLHLDVRPILNGRLGIKQAVEYCKKQTSDECLARGKGGDTSYLLPKPPKEEEDTTSVKLDSFFTPT